MSGLDTSEAIKKHPNGIFLTASNIGLEGFASIIKDETWHKIASICVPLLVAGLSFLIRRFVKHIECKRGINTYSTIIKELQIELEAPAVTKNKKLQIEKEIEKYKLDIIKLKKDNIKIFID